MYIFAPLSIAALAMATTANARYIMYLTGQHPIVPSPDLVASISHVALAFMPSSRFNEANPSAFPLFTTVKEVRTQFAEGTKIMVAIGGWGDTEGFATAAKTKESREHWAKNVKKMVEITGADGVDVDWEYPGGNGEDYKINPNPTKAWQISAYPLLLSTLRSHLPQPYLISAAVPGLPRDMLAFTSKTLPTIASSLDFFNVMTYDLMNRRDTVTKHHSGIQISLEALDAYVDGGVPPAQLNLGFGFYTKWFRTLPNSTCSQNPIGCPTALLEDPVTGGDLGQVGGFSYHDSVPKDSEKSWGRAQLHGKYDEEGGGHYFWDEEEDTWWTWDSENAIKKKVERIVESSGIGGVFAWGLGEDGTEWKHLKALNEAYLGWREIREGGRRCGTGSWDERDEL